MSNSSHELADLLALEVERELVAAARLAGVLHRLRGGRGARGGGEGADCRDREDCCRELLHAAQHALLRVQLHRGSPYTCP